MSIKQIGISRIMRAIATLTGGLSALLGLFVLIGWHTHTLWLLHIHPSFVAMAYNTALGFLLCGGGVIAVIRGHPRLAFLGGVYGLLCGALTLGEYLFQSDFGIDELFMRSYTVAGVITNARMAFNTALCFLLIGLFLLFKGASSKSVWISVMMGSLVTGLGTIALSGYLIGIANSYAWGQFTRMAVHTASGFILLGLSVLTFAWHQSTQESPSLPRWLPLPIGVGTLTLTLCLWQALIVQQQAQWDWFQHITGTQPPPHSITQMSVLIPKIALLVGVAFMILLAGLVFLAQGNAQRAFQVASTNQELSEQIVVRQEAETALQEASVFLEARVHERTAELQETNRVLQGEIVERRRLENQLLEAQKLESVGRLAGGVAHDFNNLLTVILGYSELAREEGGQDSPLQDYLDNVIHAAESAATLTKQLLTFARRQVIEPKTVNLTHLTLNLEKLLKRLIGEHIELLIVAQQDLPFVKVDPGQFEQILVNLVVNARDAMPEGGKITIETQTALLNQDDCLRHDGVVPGEYVLLTVSDTGTGMEEAVRLHIFEPFFTTKEQGRGTGLGLATVYGIVKQAGGHIWLYSEKGAGTTFKIYLPRVLTSIEATAVAPLMKAPSGGVETVLVVEDEAAVRRLTVQGLQAHGYVVLEATNGVEALQLVRGREREIALLITDVIMPQMNGKELAERLGATAPALKVLYASGYTENTIVHHGVLEPGVSFLSKPFTPTMLAHKVRQILDNA